MRAARALAALLLLASPAAAEAPAEFVAALSWPRAEGLGGISGVETDDGTRLLAVTDRGRLVTARLRRGADGAPEAIEDVALAPLLDARGRPGGRGMSDAEGLALLPSGGLAVSYEGGEPGVVEWEGPAGPGARLPAGPGWGELHPNRGLEALAVDPEGRLVAIGEGGGTEAEIAVWRRYGRGWDMPYALPRRPPFVAVGADWGPDGRLYLLERDVRLPFGFASRVRRFEIEGDAVLSEETLIETRPGRHGNLEGLAVWRDADGAIRLTMVSDDNFSTWQRGQIVEYRLPPEAPAPHG